MMNIRTLFSCLFFLLFGFALCNTASAVTLSAPPTANVSQSVTITLTTSEFVSAATPSPCQMRLNLGDGSPVLSLNMHTSPSTCQIINVGAGQIRNCTINRSHSYGTVGSYLIDARSGTCPALQAPQNARTTITITAPPTPLPTPTPTPAIIPEIDLPDGVVGMDYEYELGDRKNRYRKTIGRMDSGLKIIRNTIKGVPVREGTYRFQIRATDPRGTTTDTWYNLRITRALLKVNVEPKKAVINRNRAGSFRLRYTLSASEEINDILESSQGIFLAGSRRLGTVNTRISTKMTKGKAQLTEQVTVPLAVIKTAQRLGIEEIRYQRTFKARYMDAATTSSMAVTVGTGFTFTKIRIYFADDNSSKKFVKRNQRDIGAKVELRYEGAGLLKGYWQADDRILARVTKNLPFANARTLTLQLPKVPPLPTHSIGSHRLRFVITSPVMHIPFPQVIYIVTGEDLATLHPIHLISPVGNTTIQEKMLSFSWKSRSGISLYHLELMEKKGKEQVVVFSAFSKKATYTIPAAILLKKIHPQTEYFWKITGLDRNNKPVARSKTARFSIDDSSLQTSVPGRLLMLLDGQSEEKNNVLLDSLVKQYDLTLVARKTLPQLDRELVFFSTREDVAALSRRMQAEHREILVQPDYYYSTMGQILEGQNLQTLRNFFHLKIASTGRGVRVAVIDTGVDFNNTDLAEAVIVHENFVKESEYRGEIHGTAVAGIIGALANGKDNAGIAPDSKLLALRACEQRQSDKAAGRCYSSSLLQAIDKAMAKKATIANMSLGTSAPDTMVASALDKAAEAGMILIAPAGNNPHQEKLAFPASHPKVISVAGVLDNGKKIPNDRIADQADCVLPAQYIQVTLPGSRVSFMHGTSMASAEAAGLLADFLPDPALLSQCQTADNLLTCIATADNTQGKH